MGLGMDLGTLPTLTRFLSDIADEQGDLLYLRYHVCP
jgi:hypothetical protein